uniref:Uncharacterized protein n=1 Tax=Oryza glaberrima TaxID=4538 RepID=I1QZW9_ORYGL
MAVLWAGLSGLGAYGHLNARKKITWKMCNKIDLRMQCNHAEVRDASSAGGHSCESCPVVLELHMLREPAAFGLPTRSDIDYCQLIQDYGSAGATIGLRIRRVEDLSLQETEAAESGSYPPLYKRILQGSNRNVGHKLLVKDNAGCLRGQCAARARCALLPTPTPPVQPRLQVPPLVLMISMIFVTWLDIWIH